MTDHAYASLEDTRSVGPPRLLLLSVLFLVLAMAAYWPTLHALPVGDDWGAPLTEIVRGDLQGPWSFFAETRQLDSYRPVQSLLIWLFGQIDEPDRWVSIRILHFISLAISLVVTALIARELRLGLLASAVALGIAALHPTLAAATGSIDGFSSLLSCSAVWFGVWMMFRLRHRFALALTCAALMLFLGTLVKEYAFAMWPAAALVALCFFDKPIRRATITFITMGAIAFALIWLRRFVKPDDLLLLADHADFEFKDPKTIAFNIAMVILGGLFTGDSLAVFVERTPMLLALTGITLVLMCAFIVIGFVKAFRSNDESLGQTKFDRRWLIFLFLSPAVMSFPANTVMKIGEMYLCGVVTSVALLVGLCVQWMTRRSKIATWITSIIFILLAIQAFAAIRHKSYGIVEGGLDTKRQTDQIVKAVAQNSDVKKITLVFRRDLMPPRATFGAYRLAEIYHVRPPASDYLFPGRGIVIDSVMVDSSDEVSRVDLSASDVALLWNPNTKMYESLK
ncbi:MAG TPA: hypothetical protein PK402_07755 [Tepidisphaeraceae bacterium]|nr:hypothetical protein [Tepidisphaeraceae bacterium]